MLRLDKFDVITEYTEQDLIITIRYLNSLLSHTIAPRVTYNISSIKDKEELIKKLEAHINNYYIKNNEINISKEFIGDFVTSCNRKEALYTLSEAACKMGLMGIPHIEVGDRDCSCDSQIIEEILLTDERTKRLGLIEEIEQRLMEEYSHIKDVYINEAKAGYGFIELHINSYLNSYKKDLEIECEEILHYLQMSYYDKGMGFGVNLYNIENPFTPTNDRELGFSSIE